MRRGHMRIEDHERQMEFLADQNERNESALDDVRQALLAMYREHRPDDIYDRLDGTNRWHPGNGIGGNSVLFWCAKDQTPWPCDSWHEIRDLYHRTYGSPRSGRRARLILQWEEEED